VKSLLVFVFLLIGLLFGINANAYEMSIDDKIFVGGQAIGIKLNCGVEVVGTYAIYDDNEIYKPWDEAGINDGDKILELNGVAINSISELTNVLSNTHGETVSIKILRGNDEIKSTITPAKKNNTLSLGLYVKDSIMGVGTLTYYIQEAKIYGSLGHKIYTDKFTSGRIYEAKVDDIIKPSNGIAGEKKATISGGVIGTVEVNEDTGVQGYVTARFETDDMKLLNIKPRDEIKLGHAEILTCINGKKVESFDIEITRLVKQKDKGIKGITFKVVDEKLLTKTGGIIQGMSGSPIIQDDMLVGAVTHVSLNDSTIGYGIYIEWMLEDMGVIITE
jgi:stage IV sporulation protein B